jgi:2'-5' RNA ligase
MAGALIVTAELGAEDLAWLEGLRRRHYPAERNHVPAHLTMFHVLPPSVESELRSRLAEVAKRAPPNARLEGLMDLGGGVAFRVFSPELDRIRDELADGLHGMLGPQDRRGWRPHVTIQNKVAPKVARALIATLERDFRPRPLTIRGFGLQRYHDGRWEKLAIYAFRGR